MASTNPLASLIKSAASKASKKGTPSPDEGGGEAASDDEGDDTARMDFETAVEDFRNADSATSAADAFLAAMELAEGLRGE